MGTVARFFAAIFSVSLFMQSSVAICASLSNGKVSFLATSNAFDMPSNSIPLSGEPVLQDGKISGVFRVQVGKFESGNSTRDEQMRKPAVLDAARFPVAELVLDPTDIKGDTFTGTLKMRGVKKPVKGSMKVFGGKSFKFDFSISIKDFGIDPPSLIAVYMNDKVDISAEGDVK